MTRDDLRPGLKAVQRAVVTEAMVTTHAGGARLTTPSMIMLMEETAQELTRPYLPDDHTTVGFEISVRHLAPTPPGETVTLTAELMEVDGRKLFFTVTADNERRRIGVGTLRRTIVKLGSLEERAASSAT